MKKHIAAAAAASAIVVGGLAVTTAEPASANTPCASRAEFRAIKHGMTVLRTQQIIGSKGKVTVAGSWLSQRQWHACSGSGAFWVTLTYVNHRLDNKIML